MFVLRIGIPLAVIMMLSWLAYRWLGEDKSAVRSGEVRSGEVRTATAHRATIGGPAPLARVAYFATPCWDVKGCTEQAQAACPAHARPELPCWLANQMKTGRLKETCAGCEIYDRPVARA